jgi:hypothetical protein
MPAKKRISHFEKDMPNKVIEFKSKITLGRQQRIKEIARCKEVFTNSYPGLFITLRVLDQSI